MKKLFLLLLLGFTLVGFSQTTEIPDPNFEQALIDLGFDTAPINGSVPTANISGVTSLDVSNNNITDLTGIEDFIALTDLACESNQLTSLDVSNNTALATLNCGYNQLTSLEVSSNSALSTLKCGYNQLTSINVTSNLALTLLWCHSNPLTVLDVSSNSNLGILSCYSNQLGTLNVTSNPALTMLWCWGNQLTSLNLSDNMALTRLYCGNNLLESLDLSYNLDLTRLYCESNKLISLDVSANNALTYLNCESNQLETLNVRNRGNENIEDFKSTSNPNLTCIYVDDADYSTANWTNIDPASTFVNNEAACGVLSLEYNAFELNVTIHPNPTDNYLFIEGNKNPISISIYNLLGAEVIATSNTDKIDVSELSNGVYIIKISDGIDQTDRKFIKN